MIIGSVNKLITVDIIILLQINVLFKLYRSAIANGVIAAGIANCTIELSSCLPRKENRISPRTGNINSLKALNRRGALIAEKSVGGFFAINIPSISITIGETDLPVISIDLKITLGTDTSK